MLNPFKKLAEKFYEDWNANYNTLPQQTESIDLAHLYEQDREVLSSILDYIESDRNSFYCRPHNHHRYLVEHIESMIENHLDKYPTKENKDV